MKRPGIYGYAKLAVVQAMRYLYAVRPELQEQISAAIFILAEEYLARREEEDFADFVVAGELAFALIEDSGSEAHLQAAKALFDAGLVDEMLGGNYEEVVVDRALHHDEYKHLPYITPDDIYEHIAGFADPEDDPMSDDVFADWQPGEYTEPLPPAMLKPFIAPEKIGRNEPCPCGSGKKYKKCCLGK